jgi:RNA polymerase sigma-70 factor (ECF subfamily)
VAARFTEKIAIAIEADERRALELDFREHAGWLRSAARRRTGNTQAAEDLVQEAFVRAARYPAERRNGRPLLSRILSNLIKDRFRARSRESAAFDSFAVSVGANSVAEADQVHSIVFGDLIARMPKKLRDVFVLARFTPMTQPEIAIKLGISIKTVEWRLAKALEYCASELGG